MTAAVRIGLTGGIGSGKSTVASRLASLGALVVDTDEIARRITGPGGQAMPDIERAFGPAAVAPDGAMDRACMRNLAFQDSAVRQRLEAILHPMIGALAAGAAANAGLRPVVFDVPLLAESTHWRQRVDRILVIDCSVDTQVARVCQRPGWTADAANLVIGHQASRERRRAIADAVIHNDGITLEELHAQVDAVWHRWTARRV